jgi:hypothetical protein
MHEGEILSYSLLNDRKKIFVIILRVPNFAIGPHLLSAAC